MGPTRTPRNESGSRKTNQGPTGHTRAPWNKSGSCGMDRGPAEPPRTPYGESGLYWTIKRKCIKCNQSRIRTPDGAGPRRTNWGLTSRIVTGGTDQDPREETASAGRIRALRDASGPSETRQGPSGWMRWRSKRGGGRLPAMAIDHHQREINGGQHIFCPPPHS